MPFGSPLTEFHVSLLDCAGILACHVSQVPLFHGMVMEW